MCNISSLFRSTSSVMDSFQMFCFSVCNSQFDHLCFAFHSVLFLSLSPAEPEEVGGSYPQVSDAQHTDFLHVEQLPTNSWCCACGADPLFCPSCSPFGRYKCLMLICINGYPLSKCTWLILSAGWVFFVWLGFFLCVFFLRSPAISLKFTILGWDFCMCDCSFNPTIKVITFHLHGWCVLGVFLLPAFTRLGHEYQDLLSPCDEMHVCTD